MELADGDPGAGGGEDLGADGEALAAEARLRLLFGMVRLRGLRDLAASHHIYSDGNRLKVGPQSIGIIDNLPPCDRTVRGDLEPDALLASRKYHSVSALILALDQTSQDGLGCGQPSGRQCLPQIREAVRIT